MKAFYLCLLFSITWGKLTMDERVAQERERTEMLITKLEGLTTELEKMSENKEATYAEMEEKKGKYLVDMEDYLKAFDEEFEKQAAAMERRLNIERNKHINKLKVDIKKEYISEIYEERIQVGPVDYLDYSLANYDNESIYVHNELDKGIEVLDGYLKEHQGAKNDLDVRATAIIEGRQMTDEEKTERIEKIQNIQGDFYKIMKQVQLDAFHEEEKQRTDGNSGIKQIRNNEVGEENYHQNSHNGRSFASIHNHDNNVLTVGLGEFIGVLNGIEFRTRHNDYQLRKPLTNDKTYGAVEPITFPDVPKSVLNAGDIQAQIEELHEYFKAFYHQDPSHRDYRPYFKPVLTYLEGAWQNGEGDIDEPFESDRHHIDASDWLDLQEKVRYTSYSGEKSLLENLAYLPTKIVRFTDDNRPVIAQWNYRILCHPIETELPTSYLKLVDDIVGQKRNKYTEEQYRASRAANFDISGINVNGEHVDGPLDYTYLDKIMSEIPGKDNYGAHIDAIPFGDEMGGAFYSAEPEKDEELNAAYYHRAFLQKDSDGQQVYRGQRGFADNLYMAHTTQDRIESMSYNITADGKERKIETKVSYAVPIEIVWLTPLHSWNPYELTMADECPDELPEGTKEDPAKELCSKLFYQTPSEFFTDGESDSDAADTGNADGYIETKFGPKPVRTSGVRVNFPMIPGIPTPIRQRYPIMPIYGEGNPVWKKLNAMEDALEIKHTNEVEVLSFLTGTSHSTEESPHQHIVRIPADDYQRLLYGKKLTYNVESDQANGHTHRLTISLNHGTNEIEISDCRRETWDREEYPDKVCHDHHSKALIEQ